MTFKFEKLDVWKRAIDFADEIYQLVDELPQAYRFSLSDQLRRAALSIPTNIAEGSGRGGTKEQAYFYRVAKGSVYEVVSLLVMTGRRGHLSREQYKNLYQEADEIASILSALIKNHGA
jgi:four helix bundle protein